MNIEALSLFDDWTRFVARYYLYGHPFVVFTHEYMWQEV